MEKTWLTRRVRRGIMITLIASFFVVSPLIIFYTAGYRYDWANQEIQQTGVISIDVLPKDSRVFINGVEIKKSLPLRLPNRAPGTYTLVITHDGYDDWQKEITVESKKTTYIKNVTLFRKALPISIWENSNEEKLSLHSSSDGRWTVLLTRQQGAYSLGLLRDQAVESLWRFTADRAPEISWSPFANFLLVKADNEQQTELQLFNLDNEASKTFTFPSEQIQGWQWSSKTTLPTVYLQKNRELWQLTTAEEKQIAASSTDLWYVDGQDRLWTYDPALTSLRSGKQEYSLKEDLQRILYLDDRLVLLQTAEGITNLQLKDQQIQQTRRLPTPNLFYNRHTKEWIAWSPWELWTVYQDGSAALLNRSSEKSFLVEPLDEYGLLLLATENRLTAFNPGYYVSQDLFTEGTIKDVAIDLENHSLYFLGEVGKKPGLFSLEY